MSTMGTMLMMTTAMGTITTMRCAAAARGSVFSLADPHSSYLLA